MDEGTWLRLSGRAPRVGENAARTRSTRPQRFVSRRDAELPTRRGSRATACGHPLAVRHELCHRRRLLRGWLAKRLASFLSRMANRIARMESRRTKLATSLSASLLTEEEREQLKARVRSYRDAGRRTVVFFGSGFQGVLRHHISIQKRACSMVGSARSDTDRRVLHIEALRLRAGAQDAGRGEQSSHPYRWRGLLSVEMRHLRQGRTGDAEHSYGSAELHYEAPLASTPQAPIEKPTYTLIKQPQTF